MPDRLSRRMVLLAAYEDFTRRESVSLRDENFDLLIKLQEKKAKVIAQFADLEGPPEESEVVDFRRRISVLLEEERANASLLDEKMKENRMEHRRLSKNTVSANKFRRAYAAPVDRSVVPGQLKGRA